MKKNEIIKTYGTDFISMTQRLLEEADLAGHILEKTGGMTQDPAGALIGIKPNLVSPTPAMFGATTHPEVVEGIIRYLREHGFTNLVICEGSWVGDKTSDAFEYCGFNTLARTYGVRLFDTQKDSSFPVTCKAADPPLELHLCSCLKDIDFLINVPVLKGHCQTKMTCALKNMKGLIPNSEKRRFHALGLHRPIAYLNTVIHQDFIVVDHICGDPDFEDGGNPLVTNCIMAALDPVLTDAYACRILNYQPDDVNYIRLAAAAGVGSNDLNHLEIRQLGSSSQTGSGMNDTARLTHKALQLNYATREIESCSACYSALTEALYRLNEEGLLHRLTDNLKVTFHIGQGYQNAAEPQGEEGFNIGHPVGIGNCTRHFAHSIPGCPPTGDEIYHYLASMLPQSK